MARTPKPWFRKARNTWHVTIRGKCHNLGPDKREAFRRFYLLMADLQPDAPRPAPRLDDLIDDFLEFCHRNRSNSTYVTYRQTLENLLNSVSGQMIAEQLSIAQVNRWLDRKQCNETSRRTYVNVVCRLTSWGYKSRLLSADPLAGMEKPTAFPRERYMTDEEYSIILANSDEPFRDLITVAYECGPRPKEIIHVAAEHVDFDRQRWVFPIPQSKGRKKQRCVYLTDQAMAITQRLLSGTDGILFRNSQGNPWTAVTIDKRFQKLRTVIGRKLSLYDTRHAFCTRLLKQQISAAVVAELMGNSVEMVSRVYNHVEKDHEFLLEQVR